MTSDPGMEIRLFLDTIDYLILFTSFCLGLSYIVELSKTPDSVLFATIIILMEFAKQVGIEIELER